MSLIRSTPLPKQPAKSTRDSNIELLRILAMLGVVVLHYNNPGMGGGFANVVSGSWNHRILLTLEGLFVCAVDLFILITGYFSCTSKRADPTKAVALVLQVIVFRVIQYGFGAFTGGDCSLNGLIGALLPINYFVMQYVAVYLLSPYINIVLRKLTAAELKRFLLLVLLILSVWPTAVDVLEEYTARQFSGLSTIALTGSGHGYTLINFILLYLIGGYLRITELTVKKRYAVGILVICTALIAVGYTIIPGAIESYCNPLVILEAVAVFLLFRQLHFQNKLINTLAKGTFTCFLLHMVFLQRFDIASAVQANPLYLIGHILFVAIATYLLCFVVSVLYDFAFRPVIRLINHLVHKFGLEIVVGEQKDQEFIKKGE